MATKEGSGGGTDLTNHKGDGLDLLELESLPLLVDQLPFGLALGRIIHDKGEPRDVEFLYANLAFRTKTRIHELCGRRASELVPGLWHSVPWLLEAANRVALGGGPENVERHVAGLDEMVSLHLFSPRPGHIVATMGLDSEHRQTKRTVAKQVSGPKESDRRFHALMEASPIPSGVNDIHGNITYLNPAFTRAYGYTVNDIPNLARWWAQAYPDSGYRKQVVSEWTRRLQHQQAMGGDFDQMEVKLRTQNGEYRNAIAWASPLNTVSNDEYLITLHDVTEQKQVEQHLGESKLQLELALEASALGLWDCDIGSGRVRVNGIWRSMLGFGPEDEVPSFDAWSQLIHPDDQRMVLAAIQGHLGGETEAYESEHRIRHRQGHWVWILARGRVTARDAKGQPLRATGTMRDIGDRKRLRQDATDLLHNIEKLIVGIDSRRSRNGTVAMAETLPIMDATRLTRRQEEVLRLIAGGLTSPQIANRLNISHATAITHRRDLMRKLQAHSTAELTRYALRHGLLSD